jgi:hypothetical protein
MAEPRMFPNSHETPESKSARNEAHLFHLWQQQNELKAELAELRKDRAALLRRIGAWAVTLLVAALSAIFSKGSTIGFLAQKMVETLIGAS